MAILAYVVKIFKLSRENLIGEMQNRRPAPNRRMERRSRV